MNTFFYLISSFILYTIYSPFISSQERLNTRDPYIALWGIEQPHDTLITPMGRIPKRFLPPHLQHNERFDERVDINDEISQIGREPDREPFEERLGKFRKPWEGEHVDKQEYLNNKIQNDVNNSQTSDSVITEWVRNYSSNLVSSNDRVFDMVFDPNDSSVIVTGITSRTFSGYDYLTIKYDCDGETLWTASYNGPGNSSDYAYAITIDALGNVYVTGGSRDSGIGRDYATIKYNKLGVQQWVARYNESENSDDYAIAIVLDALGNVYVTGCSATIKYNSNGEEQWVARYTGGIAFAIAVDASDNVYVTGLSGVYPNHDYATIKYNTNGVQQWAARYNGPGNNWDKAYAIAVDPLGNVYVTGSSRVSGTDYDYATIKYNGNGEEQWVAIYNGPGNSYDIAYAITVDAMGNVYVSGYSEGSGTAFDYATIKYNTDGGMLWIARYNGPGNTADYAYAITVDLFGNVYVTGSSYGTGTFSDYATIKYNANGVQQWVARYNGTGNSYDGASAIAVDIVGNVYVAGYSYSGAFSDYATFKYNANGEEQWVAIYDRTGNSSDYAGAITVGPSGNVYVTGYSGGSETKYDYVTIKYSTNGEEQWVTRYNGPGNSDDEAYAISVDQSGNVYVTGSSASSNAYPDNYDYATVKYNTNGEEQWVARYNGPGNSDDEAYAITIDSSGNVYITGYSHGSGTSSDYATIKYNTNGVEQWVARYNGPGYSDDYATAISVDASGNVYVTGYSGDSWTGYDYATIKYNTNGVEQWVARYNGPENFYDEAYAITIDPLGNVYVTGYSEGSEMSSDYATIKYNLNGEEQWVARYNGSGNSDDEAYAISVDQLGNVHVTGSSYGSGTSFDYATIKYNTNGEEQWAATYNGTGNSSDESRAITVDRLGNVYVTGSSGGSGTSYDYTTIKYDTLGVQQWVARYNGSENSSDYAYAVTVDPSGDVYVTGYSGYAGGAVFTTVKYNQLSPKFAASPNELLFENIAVGCRETKSLCINNKGWLNLEITAVEVNDSNFMITPNHAVLIPSDSIHLNAIFIPLRSGEKMGKIIFHHNALSSPDTVFVSGTGTSEGTEIIISENYGTGWRLISLPVFGVCPYVLGNLFEYNGRYVVCDTLKNKKGYWKKYNLPEVVRFIGEKITSDSIDVTSGWNMIGSISYPVQVSSIGIEPPDMIVSEFFTYKDEQYVSCDTIQPGVAYWVKPNKSGKLILDTTSSIMTNKQIKIIPNGELPPPPPGDHQITLKERPNKFALEQNYPNPFNPVTIINYQLPIDNWVTLKVYNIFGQEVRTLVDGMQAAGYKSAEFDATNMASGVYYYKLTVGGFVDVKKMILLR